MTMNTLDAYYTRYLAINREIEGLFASEIFDQKTKTAIYDAINYRHNIEQCMLAELKASADNRISSEFKPSTPTSK